MDLVLVARRRHVGTRWAKLDGDGYRHVATHPLAWLLDTDPRDYLTD